MIIEFDVAPRSNRKLHDLTCCLQLIIRDPILYIGRAVMFLIACMIFGLVYLSARDDTQGKFPSWIDHT